jgi:hypothetical protein
LYYIKFFRNELDETIIETFIDFVYELLTDNELQLARLLRKKLLFKLDLKKNETFPKDNNIVNNNKKISESITISDNIDTSYSLNSFTK